jgi:creatinine amidohydrolase/Fe(II)-dependent formamide hydrolase-like protein
MSWNLPSAVKKACLLTVFVFILAALTGCSAGEVPAQQTEMEAGIPIEPKVERRWEKLYGNELFRLIEERPLAWLSVGVIERHGEHLPWGLDADKAHLICIRLADKYGGVVLPASHLAGVHGDRRPDQSEENYRRANRQAADMMYTEGYFHRFLQETFDGLANLGFRVIVAYSGHWPSIQAEILQEEAARFNSGGRATVIPFGEIMACGVVDHGAKYEGSMWAALVPGGVRQDSIVDYSTGRKGWYRGAEIRSQISAEFGEEVLGMIEEYLKAEIDRAFAGQEKKKNQ